MFFQAFKDSKSKQLESLLIPSFFLCNIREIRIWDCPQLKSVFTLSNAITMQLEYLSIRGCDGLKHIITVSGDDDANYTSILPKLNTLYIIGCKQLEYVFGESHQNHTSNLKIDIHLPALEYLNLESLSNMISICSTRYYLNCPSLKRLWIEYCPQFAITSITDFMIHSNARQLEYINMKVPLYITCLVYFHIGVWSTHANYIHSPSLIIKANT